MGLSQWESSPGHGSRRSSRGIATRPIALRPIRHRQFDKVLSSCLLRPVSRCPGLPGTTRETLDQSRRAIPTTSYGTAPVVARLMYSISGRQRVGGLDAGGWDRTSRNEVEEENEREAMTIGRRRAVTVWSWGHRVSSSLRWSLPPLHLPFCLLFVFLCLCLQSPLLNIVHLFVHKI